RDGVESFEQLLEAELSKVLPDVAPARIGAADSVLATYAGNARMTQVAEAVMAEHDVAAASGEDADFWPLGPAAARSLHYYQRMVELASDNNINVAFYFMPELLAPPAREAELASLRAHLG